MKSRIKSWTQNQQLLAEPSTNNTHALDYATSFTSYLRRSSQTPRVKKGYLGLTTPPNSLDQHENHKGWPAGHQQLKHLYKTKINKIIMSAPPLSFYPTGLTISELTSK